MSENSEQPSDSSSTDLVCKVIKLTTNEIIIAGVQKQKQGFVLQRPMLIQTIDIYGKNMKIKQSSVAMKSWIEYSDDHYYVLPKSMVVTIADPSSDIVEMYQQVLVEQDMWEAKNEISDIVSSVIQSAKEKMTENYTSNLVKPLDDANHHKKSKVWMMNVLQGKTKLDKKYCSFWFDFTIM